MRIAGIDPGTINTGLGILDEKGSAPVLVFSGTIRPGQSRPLPERLLMIYQELKSAFTEWRPDVMALETVFYQKDFKAAVKVGEARAAAMLAAAECDIPVVEYPPARIKQAIGGNGRASKEQIEYMVRQRIGLKGTLSKDSADAIAVALCHLQSYPLDQLKKRHPAHVSVSIRNAR